VATGIVTGLTIQRFNASNGLLKLSTSPGRAVYIRFCEAAAREQLLLCLDAL
jgi:hypothetical protein